MRKIRFQFFTLMLAVVISMLLGLNTLHAAETLVETSYQISDDASGIGKLELLHHTYGYDNNIMAWMNDLEIDYIIHLENNLNIIIATADVSPSALDSTDYTAYFKNISYITKVDDQLYFYDLNGVLTDSVFTALDLYLYAEMSDRAYHVSFNSYGGSLINSINVVTGEVIAKPTNPVRTGYTFNGWYSDEVLTAAYDFETLVDADITLYAKWTVSTATTAPPASSLTATHWVIISLSVIVLGYLAIKGSKK